MKVSSGIQAVPLINPNQSISKESLPIAEGKEEESFNLDISEEGRQNIILGQERMTLNSLDSFYEAADSLWESAMGNLSEEEHLKMDKLELEMQDYFKKEEDGSITREEQQKLDSLFASYDKIAKNGFDKNGSGNWNSFQSLVNGIDELELSYENQVFSRALENLSPKEKEEVVALEEKIGSFLEKNSGSKEDEKLLESLLDSYDVLMEKAFSKL